MNKPTLRCAIYTRKSSEEGLDQAFNSLQAQRESCEAYILSQAGEGWTPLPALYDDGGISGGTMERPGLKRLLADIDRGHIDVVVVYKVDRLTRSLADFAKIVERFDQRQVSFVSVTQAFNTTNSMGRLTLNVLLSFAQFEREVTGERIRDKIAASKKKGMWMGGLPPLGYDRPTDPVTRALVPNAAEAAEVVRLFERYLALGSAHAVIAELQAAGQRTAVKIMKHGAERGGAEWSRGALFHLLRNRIYLGEIPHKDQTYPGNHPAIVDQVLFDAVQRSLDANKVRKRDRPLKPEGSPLMGKLFDAEGVPMTPALAYGKAGQKYRYYVSRPLQLGSRKALDREIIRRISAGAIEGLVMDRLVGCGLIPADGGWIAIREAVARLQIDPAELVIEIYADAISDDRLAQAREALEADQRLVRTEGRKSNLQLILPGRTVFRGGRTWLASPDGRPIATRRAVDATLVRALKRSHAVVTEAGLGPTSSVLLRQSRGIISLYDRSVGRLSYLAPDIQSAIMAGTQPAGLTLERLIKSEIPLSWPAQRAAFGFAINP